MSPAAATRRPAARGESRLNSGNGIICLIFCRHQHQTAQLLLPTLADVQLLAPPHAEAQPQQQPLLSAQTHVNGCFPYILNFDLKTVKSAVCSKIGTWTVNH